MRPASTHALTFRYMVVLFLIALLSLFAYLTLNYIVSRGSQLGGFVRISDEQQMCAQRVAYFSLRLSQSGSASEHDVCRTRLKEETGQLLADEDELVRKGGPLDQIVPVAPEAMSFYFDEPLHLDKEVRDYAALARKVAAVPEGELVFDDPDVAAIQEKNYNELIEGVNKVVQQLRDDWENQRHLAVDAQLVVLSLTLATLIAVGFFVFRPMVKLIIEENHELMASERRLMAVFDTVGEAIFSADKEGKILSVNSEAARLWEYEIKDIIGENVDHLFFIPDFFRRRASRAQAPIPPRRPTLKRRPFRAMDAVFRRKSPSIGPRSMGKLFIPSRPAISPSNANTRSACSMPRKWPKPGAERSPNFSPT